MKLRPSTKLPPTWSNKVHLLRPRLLTNRPSGPKPLLLFLLCVMTSFTLLTQQLKAGGCSPEWRPAGGFFHWGTFSWLLLFHC